MKTPYKSRLDKLAHPEYVATLQGIRRGIEKESLRVNRDASLATTPHPASLGSPLTHECITTDYAETQMEFISPVGTEAEETLGILADIHRHVYGHLKGELLWPMSMPCAIEKESDIELARYGTSNVGKLKTVYRRGLKNRYGSMMQVIAGVHYNFSMPDSFWPMWQQIKNDRRPLQEFISESYLGLIRNFMRIGWLVPYLFGASPAVDSTFVTNARSRLFLQTSGRASYSLPHATSLRMSDLGYSTEEQADLAISYNSLAEFISGLRKAASQSNPVFKRIGIQRRGEYQQLNTHTLQQEGELYAPIRPKRPINNGERLSDALQTNGIEYVEVRSLDVNPYAPTGIDLEQVYFLDVLLTYCLLQDSPKLSRQQLATTKRNMSRVATDGRNPSLVLQDDASPRLLTRWAADIFSDLTEVARLLDEAYHGQQYQRALDGQRRRVDCSALTPSARILKDMEAQDLEVTELALRLAKQHRRALLERSYTEMKEGEFVWEAVASLHRQRELEATDSLCFNEFLRLASTGSAPGSPSPHDIHEQPGQWVPLCDHTSSCKWCCDASSS